MAKRNVHTGSIFDDFLKEEGIFEEVQAKALGKQIEITIKPGHKKAA